MKCGILVDITKHVNKLNVILKLSIPCILHIKVHSLLHQLNAPKHAGVAQLIFVLIFALIKTLHLVCLISGPF
jgi:hypothetical protein